MLSARFSAANKWKYNARPASTVNESAMIYWSSRFVCFSFSHLRIGVAIRTEIWKKYYRLIYWAAELKLEYFSDAAFCFMLNSDWYSSYITDLSRRRVAVFLVAKPNPSISQKWSAIRAGKATRSRCNVCNSGSLIPTDNRAMTNTSPLQGIIIIQIVYCTLEKYKLYYKIIHSCRQFIFIIFQN